MSDVKKQAALIRRELRAVQDATALSDIAAAYAAAERVQMEAFDLKDIFAAEWRGGERR